MTGEEYQRICARLARKAIRFATKMVADEEPSNGGDGDVQREHWISVFLDEHLPDIDADALLEVTLNAGAFEKSARRQAPSRDVAAVHAFQADVRDAINREALP